MKFRQPCFVFGLLFLILTGCSHKKRALDLIEEARYAQRNHEFVFLDYLRKESSVRREEGWTPLSQKGTRIGIFPSSRLHFTVDGKETVYLSFRCKPISEGIHSARSLRIRVNSQRIGQIELKPDLVKFIQTPIPPQFLRKGENTLHFVYNPGSRSQGDKTSEKERGERFSLMFSQLLITSFEDQRSVEQCLRVQEMEKNRKGVLIQRIPGEIDYFLRISPGSSFRAQCRFLPLSSSRQIPLNIHLISQKPGSEEQVVCKESIPVRHNETSLDVKLKGVEGIVKLGLRAGKKSTGAGIQGFLVWNRAAILQKKRHRPEKSVSPKRLSRLRRSLKDKNIIIVVLDAARPDHFSTYGYFRPTTPHISRFSQNSVVFTQAFSEALTTRCSIGTLFTGFPLAVTSVTGLFSKLPSELPTLAQLFRSKGYYSAGFTGMGNISSDFNFHRGFDEYVELFKKEGFRRRSQEYLPYLFPWLERNKDKKFFLYIHFKEPHAVYKPVPDFQGLFSSSYEKKVDLEVYKNLSEYLTPSHVEYIRACYDETLASVDSVLGKLLEKIRNLGLLEKTAVILTADHGEFLGEKNKLFGHGQNFYEPGIRIPLLIHFPVEPEEKSPARIKAMVKMSDLFTTLADIHQFDVPDELMEGKSLLPLLLKPEREVNSRVILGKRGTPGHCIRTDRYKLIYWEKSQKVQFYDLKKDPKEQKNLYTQQSVRANYMLVELKKWVDRQRAIRKHLIQRKGHEKVQERKIDKRTLENLKALGYIK